MKSNTSVLKSKQKSSNKMTANNILLYYTYRLVPSQLSLEKLPPAAEENSETHSQTLCRVNDCRTFRHNGMSLPNPFPESSENPTKRR